MAVERQTRFEVSHPGQQARPYHQFIRRGPHTQDPRDDELCNSAQVQGMMPMRASGGIGRAP
jgi:hypothetical protein